MDRHQNRLSVGGVKFCVISVVTRNLFQVCLLVLLVGSQPQVPQQVPNTTLPTTTTTTRAPPKTDIPVTFDVFKENPKSHMRFCDTEYPIYDDDFFCTRVVAVVAHENEDTIGSGQIVVPGIFIDDRRVLTSYTPFRILRNTMPLSKIYINYLIAKAWKQKEVLVGYFFGRMKLSCARQIVAMEHNVIVDEQWHGSERTHTPMHDLMILQVERKMEFINYVSWHETELNKNKLDVEHVGPNITEIAEAHDDFPAKYKIVSLGFMDDNHVFNRNHLHTSKEYETDDRVREDCEEWFPRDWGFFICLKNADDFVSVGSGALLVGSDETLENGTGKVFGIGSFMLKKNKASILVFTDIRPYLEAMNMTCNGFDGH